MDPQNNSAAGALGCAGGGLASRKAGPALVAFVFLAVSGACCLFSPFLYGLPAWLFLSLMLVWGMAVSGDSPQFSTLIAGTAPPELVGSALTIVNCVGFSITVISIEMVNRLAVHIGPDYLFLLLAIGPGLGLLFLKPLINLKPL